MDFDILLNKEQLDECNFEIRNFVRRHCNASAGDIEELADGNIIIHTTVTMYDQYKSKLQTDVVDECNKRLGRPPVIRPFALMDSSSDTDDEQDNYSEYYDLPFSSKNDRV